MSVIVPMPCAVVMVAPPLGDDRITFIASVDSTAPSLIVATVTVFDVSLGRKVSVPAVALKSLPVGTAYAVWTGIGTVGTALLGIYLLGEPATAIRLACIALIVAGIVGLKVVA